MTFSPLVNLSDKLRLDIVEILQSEEIDLFNFSSTCRSYRAFLLPMIFTKVTLRNGEKSGLTVQELLRSEKKIYVKELHYKGVTAIPPHPVVGGFTTDEDLDVPEAVLSSSTREVLCDLKRFPSLDRLVVEFPWQKEDLIAGFYHFEEVEREEQLRESEGKEAWRALMARTYTSIGENKDLSTVKSLDLRSVVAKSVSSWWTADFKAFLGSLQEFRLSITGMENGAGWCQSTNDGYLDFLSKLGDNLTSHLHNVETLSVAGNDKGLIGCEGMRHAPSSLGVEHIPRLRHLHLQYFFLDPPLIEFVEAHAETLETIVLDECLGTGKSSLAENGCEWKELFDRIAAKTPNRLARLELTWEHMGLPWGEPHLRGDQEFNDAQGETGKVVLDSGRRPFAYGQLDSKYGMLFQDEDDNVDKLVQGDDFKAYCKLMDIVKANARRL